MKQFYRLIQSGQWFAACYEGGGARPDAIAKTHGYVAGSVEMVEALSDPRSGQLIPDPFATPVETPIPDTELSDLVTLLAKRDSDITAAELKAVALTVARRLARKGRL